jgi:hypothetical protein
VRLLRQDCTEGYREIISPHPSRTAVGNVKLRMAAAPKSKDIEALDALLVGRASAWTFVAPVPPPMCSFASEILTSRKPERAVVVERNLEAPQIVTTSENQTLDYRMFSTRGESERQGIAECTCSGKADQPRFALCRDIIRKCRRRSHFDFRRYHFLTFSPLPQRDT